MSIMGEDGSMLTRFFEAIILCCRSGMRSGAATSQLKLMGFTNVYNAGSYHKMQALINQK